MPVTGHLFSSSQGIPGTNGEGWDVQHSRILTGDVNSFNYFTLGSA